jgi:hypothetical protein
MAINWGSVGSGALSGAGTGATIGGWPGALVGGLFGAGTGLLGGGAKNDKRNKYPTGTPEQQGLHDSIIARAMGMNQQGGGYDLANQYNNNLLGPDRQKAYDQFSAPYLQQFNEQTLPQIAERFAGIGGQYGANSGALSSSGFGQAIGGAASGLQAKLAQLFSSLQGQAAQQQYGQFNQLSQTGLNYDPFAYGTEEGSSGFGGAFAEGVSGNMEGILSGIMSLFKQKPGSGTTAIPNKNPFGVPDKNGFPNQWRLT